MPIYDGQGRLVRKLELGWKEAGYYTTAARAIYWDGRNANGESVSSGVYFYRLQAGDYSQTQDGDPEEVSNLAGGAIMSRVPRRPSNLLKLN